MTPFARLLPRLAAVALALVASCASAQATFNGPYYAMPSWDQTLPVASRFLVLSNFNNDAVLDRETGLVWQRAPRPVASTYINTAGLCGQQVSGNRGGWRMPTNAELATLFEPSSTAVDGLPVGHPFLGVGARQELFWSSTPDGIGGRAGAGTIGAAGVSSVVLYALLPVAPGVLFRAWCVRGGANAAG